MPTNNIFQSLREYFKQYFTLTPFLIPQEEAEASIREGVSFRGMTSMILIAAIFIASLGLNTNSTAVIIGAMLISPLMGPIIGMGLGIGIQDVTLIKRSFHNLAMATGISVLASTAYFIISPVTEGSSELLARTSPSIYDVLIGFFGGLAGILAIGSRSKGNVIPGVAIATALMPPLCTVGYGLATLQPQYFFGALYLYLINSIYIAFATTIGVKLMGYHKIAAVDTKRTRRIRKVVYTIVVITMLPAIYLTYDMLRENAFQRDASQFVNTEFHFADTQVLSHKASSSKDGKLISITLIGKPLPVDSLRLAMTSRLPQYGLSGAKLEIIQGSEKGSFNPAEASSVMLRDIYQVTQATIDRQAHTIDSLRAANALRMGADTLAARIAPELRILFPQVRDIAITRSVASNVSTGELDTMNIALVRFNRRMDIATKHKFTQYLESRLQMPRISIVENNAEYTPSR